jgi:hypothetical protein
VPSRLWRLRRWLLGRGSRRLGLPTAPRRGRRRRSSSPGARRRLGVAAAGRGWRRRSTAAPAVARRRRRWGNGRSRCWRRRAVSWFFRLAGSLLLFQEVDDEVLVVLDEVIVQTVSLELLAKVLSPVRVEGLEGRKLRGRSATAIEAERGDSRVGRRCGRRRGRNTARRVRGCLVGVVSMAAEQAAEKAMLVTGDLCGAAEGLGSCSSAGVLLPVVHLLLELFGLLFVDEG